MTVKKLLQSLARYMAARESYSHGRKTVGEAERIATEEAVFGDELVDLIDARIAVALARGGEAHTNGVLDGH